MLTKSFLASLLSRSALKKTSSSIVSCVKLPAAANGLGGSFSASVIPVGFRPNRKTWCWTCSSCFEGPICKKYEWVLPIWIFWRGLQERRSSRVRPSQRWASLQSNLLLRAGCIQWRRQAIPQFRIDADDVCLFGRSDGTWCVLKKDDRPIEWCIESFFRMVTIASANLSCMFRG